MDAIERPAVRCGSAVPIAVIATLVLSACDSGGTQVVETEAAPAVASTPSPTPSMSAECLAAAPPPIDKQKLPRPPDEGLSHAERTARDNAHFDQAMRNLAEWEASAAVQSQDLRALTRIESLSSPMPGEATLEESVRRADLAVLGTVVHTKAVDHGLLTEFRVERTAKGRHQDQVTFGQDSAVTPLYGFASPCAQLSFVGAYPPLLVGDRAVLLLQKVEGDLYITQPWSGQYRSTAGRVASTEMNQFHDVDGHTETQLMDRIADT